MILSCLYIRVVVLVAGEFFHYLSQGKVVYCKYVLGELSGCLQLHGKEVACMV